MKVNKSLILRVTENIFRVELQVLSAGLAFMTVLSLIPFLALCLMIFEWMGAVNKNIHLLANNLLSKLQTSLPAWLDNWIPQLRDYINEDLTNTILVKLNEILSRIDFNTIGITGFIALLLTSVKLVDFIRSAFEIIWKTKTSMTFLKKWTRYTLFTLFGPLLIAATTTVFYKIGSSVLPNQITLFFCLIIIFYVLFSIMPPLFVSFKAAVYSSFFCSTTLVIFYYGFKIAIENMLNYNKIYGSLASFPIMLTGILVFWNIVLIGAEICKFVEEKSSQI